ncbi:MAG: hypothetical protein IPJ07_09035 [Acidobacteria bacterium]|nr:hypothetical protein [Acidobacteriota bacterium]
MHMRGKDFKFTLVYPDGTSKVLLNIPRWDFNWQLTYVFSEELPHRRAASSSASLITITRSTTSSIPTRRKKSDGDRKPGKR